MRDSRNDARVHGVADGVGFYWRPARLLTLALLTTTLAGATVGTCYGAGLFDIMRGGGSQSAAATSAATTSAAATSAGAATSAAATSAVATSSAVTGPAGIAIKASTEDYSWDELAVISDAISASGDDSSALAIAEQYNLCTPDGRLDGTQTKSITLKNGVATSATIVGFYHDTVSGNGNRAGITFMFTDIIADHEMNIESTNTYGWSGSMGRLWLATDMLQLLPDDLIADVIPVDKLTNNVGMTDDPTSVTVTSDRLWLFSWCEITGGLNGSIFENSVLDAEGTQYQLFSDMTSNLGIDPSKGLGKSGDGTVSSWWLRSCQSKDDWLWAAVDEQNTSLCSMGSSESEGMVPGFCIGTAAQTTPAASVETPTATQGALTIDLSDPTTYYNVNIFLSNFVETQFFEPGDFDVANGDIDRMFKYADLHIDINDNDWIESTPDYASGGVFYTDSDGIGYGCRLSWDHIEWAIQYYFGVSVTPDMFPNLASDGTYYYMATASGDVHGGIALSESAEDLGNNEVAVTIQTFTGVMQSTYGDDIYGWSIDQAASADASAPFHVGKNGTYRCVLQVYEDEGKVKYHLLSCTAM